MHIASRCAGPCITRSTGAPQAWAPQAFRAGPLRRSGCSSPAGSLAAAAAARRRCSAVLVARRECLRAAARHICATSAFEAQLADTYLDEMRETAKYISRPGHGILASDESNATTGKRLDSVGVENTETNRRDWRELLYTAPGLGDAGISGCIMFEETLYQSTADGKPFVDVLRDQGIVPGIKVDTGLNVLPGTSGETATQGLDGLGDRCKAYYKQGARFAKWRAVIKIDDEGCPSTTAIHENAHGLARYAQICQENGLVPIVEPEVTLGPGDYSIETTAYWSERVYSHVFRLLNEYHVQLDCILLKPNMVLPGLDAPTASPAEVAKYTVRTCMRTVPPAVPGIHFLSGGMSEEESTQNLQALQDEVARLDVQTGWRLTFSYGRALQSATLKAWSGDPENKNKAQKILVALAKANSSAQLGQYSGDHPVPGGGRILQALRFGGAGK